MPKADVVVRAPVSGKNDAQPGFSLLSAWLKSCYVEDESSSAVPCILPQAGSGRFFHSLGKFREVRAELSPTLKHFGEPDLHLRSTNTG